MAVIFPLTGPHIGSFSILQKCHIYRVFHFWVFFELRGRPNTGPIPKIGFMAAIFPLAGPLAKKNIGFFTIFTRQIKTGYSLDKYRFQKASPKGP